MARILKDFPSVSLRTEELHGKIDFLRLFRRPGPVHIEIGSGKATFLLNQARAHPHLNFLAIEWANKYYRFAVDRIGRWGLNNVRIIRADAATLLAQSVPDHDVECFHIYFPDPWPKRRHHKRRFFCHANLHQIIRTLKTGGTLNLATDHADYFQWITDLIRARKDRLEQTEFRPTAGAEQKEWVGTNFERKYRKDNRKIYVLAVRKV
jgi:tRNA (guanine-N7-)-methyltransferase